MDLMVNDAAEVPTVLLTHGVGIQGDPEGPRNNKRLRSREKLVNDATISSRRMVNVRLVLNGKDW